MMSREIPLVRFIFEKFSEDLGLLSFCCIWDLKERDREGEIEGVCAKERNLWSMAEVIQILDKGGCFFPTKMFLANKVTITSIFMMMFKKFISFSLFFTNFLPISLLIWAFSKPGGSLFSFS